MFGLKVYWIFLNIRSFLTLIPFSIKLRVKLRRDMRELNRAYRTYARSLRRETIRSFCGVFMDALDLCFGWLIRCTISFFRNLKNGFLEGFIKPILAFCGYFLLYFILTPVILYSFAVASLPGLLFISSWFASIIVLLILKSAFVWIPLGLYLLVVMYLTCGSLFSDDVLYGKKRKKQESGSDDHKYDDSGDKEYGNSEAARNGLGKNIFYGMDVIQAKETYRNIMKCTHPDNGGSTEDTADITRQYQEYKKGVL